MNYDFCLRSIAVVPHMLYDALVLYAKSLDYDVSTTMWDMTRHTGITGRRFDKGEVHSLINSLINIDGLRKYRKEFFNYEIDVLAPGGRIELHSDALTIGSRCNEMHRVHVPLTGWGLYYFEVDGKPQIYRMSHGGVYLFNNYIPHAVTNAEVNTVPRINIMLNYEATGASKDMANPHA